MTNVESNDLEVGGWLEGLPGWVPWVAATLAGTTWHVLIDMHLGLYGPVSDEMSAVEGLWGLATSVLLAWWLLLVLLAVAGRAGALEALLVVTAVQGLLFNGIVGVLAAPPPSDAFPFQDIAHFVTVIAGAGAVRLLWRRRTGAWREPRGRLLMTVTILLMAVGMALAAPLNLDALANG